MILLILSFIAGVLTVFAPCILPLLPIIVGGSLYGDTSKKKIYTITASLGVSVIVFTLLLKVSTVFIHVPQRVWSDISGTLIVALGLITLFPALWEGNLLNSINRGANKLVGVGVVKNNFWGDVLVGSALGPVFSTCSPTYFVVLASVLPNNFFLGMAYLLLYVVGLCATLTVVALVGQRVLSRFDFLSNPSGVFRKIIGVVFIIVGVAVFFGIDKVVEERILASGFYDVTRIEQKLLTSTSQSNPTPSTYYRMAPEITNPSGFINTNDTPITLASLKGKKIVLVDIWTYSCINCRRTIPYINAWYSKYKDQGLEVVSIHTPEFSFEKVKDNVAQAVKELGIQYPVVLDNDYGTWNAFGNQYWPRKYIIDLDGNIVYDHIGEGGYEETERVIQKLLENNKSRLGIVGSVSSPLVPALGNEPESQSPETYFGASRNEYLDNGEVGKVGRINFVMPQDSTPNKLYLGGVWDIYPEYAETTGKARIVYTYTAKHVYMVASSDTPQDIEVYQDGKLVRKITIFANTLYTLVDNQTIGEHVLEIRIPKEHFKAFTFTFG